MRNTGLGFAAVWHGGNRRLEDVSPRVHNFLFETPWICRRHNDGRMPRLHGSYGRCSPDLAVGVTADGPFCCRSIEIDLMGRTAPVRAKLSILPNTNQEEPSAMRVKAIRIDLAKHIFQIHGADGNRDTVL